MLELPNRGRKVMKILNWRKTEPPDFDNIPQTGGIYIISTRQEADHEFEVKYIGQADNLLARIKDHWSKNEKNKELKAHIAEKYMMKINYSVIESKSDRDGMLLYMYQVFNPPFNHEPPPGTTAINCTIPAVRKFT